MQYGEDEEPKEVCRDFVNKRWSLITAQPKDMDTGDFPGLE